MDFKVTLLFLFADLSIAQPDSLIVRANIKILVA